MPLLGVPLGIKDVILTKGVRTTCASKMLENYLPPYTATCLERLEAAGSVTLGKLNMDEFAMGGSNENSAFGRVEHPTHPGYVPGGSSGGSATAVGAGLALATLGTDTGGSIRLPASFCGIVGMKPSYSRVSRYGVIAFASSLDQVGPMTRTVEDSARLLEVMGGWDARDSTTAPGGLQDLSRSLQSPRSLKGLRVGIPKEYEAGAIEPEVETRIQKTLEWMKSKGAILVPIELPHTVYSVAVYYIVAVSEASSNLSRYDGVRYGVRPNEANQVARVEEFYEKVRSLFGAEVKKRIILGTFALSSGYYDAYYRKACQVRELMNQDFQKAFSHCDVIAGPVCATPAFPFGLGSRDPMKLYLNDLFTIPANLVGLPAISVPCGTVGNEKLPVGLHLMAPALQDSLLLQVAHQVEMGLSRDEKEAT
jgi:aspartyl-tRNA(Asn)/glutamyl-tRNA(Gln) amidotransferase subunit A